MDKKPEVKENPDGIWGVLQELENHIVSLQLAVGDYLEKTEAVRYTPDLEEKRMVENIPEHISEVEQSIYVSMRSVDEIRFAIEDATGDLRI